MKRIATYTLGCKVNQYDTEAMLEAFERAGYRAVPFEEAADVYLVNTCTVTGQWAVSVSQDKQGGVSRTTAPSTGAGNSCRASVLSFKKRLISFLPLSKTKSFRR